MATLPKEQVCPHGCVGTPSQSHGGNARRHRRRAGQDRSHALLLLRSAVRDQPEGQGQSGHRFRAAVRLSVHKGMLCPKGVKRYLRVDIRSADHRAAARSRGEGGFAPMAYDAAIARVASEIERIQTTYGPNTFGVLSGASLTTERPTSWASSPGLPEDEVHRLQRPPLHVSAGAANKRPSESTAAPIRGRHSQIRGRARWPDRTPRSARRSHELHLAGARERRKLIVVDPRITPIARTADIFLPVKPGRDVALFNGILHLMSETTGSITTSSRRTPSASRPSRSTFSNGRRSTRPSHRSRGEVDSCRRGLWGTAKTSFLMHARGIEHHSHGVENCLSTINIVLASAGFGNRTARTGRGGSGERTGRPRAWAEGRSTARLARHLESRAQGVHRRCVGREAGGSPEAGVDCYEMMRKIDAGRSRGCF